MDYVVKIDEFSGPLDLLLHLIKLNDVDIYDISIEKITDQYLEYINQMEKLDINVASEYLGMAAELMLIKSSLLLPDNKDKIEDENNEEDISRDNLINRLVEYQKYKELTNDLKELEKKRHDVYTKAPSKIRNVADVKFINETDTSVNDLIDAFSKFLERKDLEKPLNTKVTNKEYSVRKRKSSIKSYLQDKDKVEFRELFDIYNKSYVIVTFLSILELIKDNEVDVKQDGNFKDIYIKLKKKN